jgi:hypothetical protein
MDGSIVWIKDGPFGQDMHGTSLFDKLVAFEERC